MSWDSPFLLLRAAKGAENGYLKQLPLKKTLVFFFLDFLRGIAMAVFIRKHIHYKLVKIRKLKSFIYEKDFSFLCFLMKMPLRASVLRRGTFGAKVPKTWATFPMVPQIPTGDQRERFSLWKPFRQSGADWESRKRQYGEILSGKRVERAEFAPNF